MKKNKKFKVWMVTRIDQSLILAKYLNDKKLLVRWDSFIRLKKSGFLRFFFPYSKRILDDKLTKISGNHYLPEIISRTLNFFKFKKNILASDMILAKLARYNAPDNFDILHGQGPYSLESGVLAKKMGKKFIYEISGQMQKTRQRQLGPIYKKYKLNLDTGINYLQKRRALEAKIADAIIVPSKYLKKELCSMGYDKKKIYTYNHDSNLSKELLTIKKVTNKKKFIIVFVGEISIAKGLQHVISVQKKLQSLGFISELHIFGRDKHNFLKLDTDTFNIFFHGQVRKNILKKYYSKSDLLILPSYTEGSPLVVFEAMAAALPVITTEESGSLVVHNHNGYICKPNDEKKMLYFVKKLIKERDLCHRMGLISRKIYKKKMRISYQEQIVNIYIKVLAKI